MKDMKTYIAPAIVWMEMDEEELLQDSPASVQCTMKLRNSSDAIEYDDDYRHSKSFSSPDDDSNWDDFGF